MTRKQNSFYRDPTFNYHRRDYGWNIPSTDLDGLEFDRFQPIDLREYKSDKSGWRTGKRTGSAKAVYNLAELAGIPFYIIEHNDDYSKISVCLVSSWNGSIPLIDEKIKTLPEYICSLYEARKRTIPLSIQVPSQLTPITQSHLICHLIEELDQNERLRLLDNLQKHYGSE